jgi:hypothetical protein
LPQANEPPIQAAVIPPAKASTIKSNQTTAAGHFIVHRILLKNHKSLINF